MEGVPRQRVQNEPTVGLCDKGACRFFTEGLAFCGLSVKNRKRTASGPIRVGWCDSRRLRGTVFFAPLFGQAKSGKKNHVGSRRIKYPIEFLDSNRYLIPLKPP